MPRKPKEPKEKKVKVPTFQRLNGGDAKHHEELCVQCKKNYAYPNWDTILHGERLKFCRGECVYLYLHERHEKLLAGTLPNNQA